MKLRRHKVTAPHGEREYIDKGTAVGVFARLQHLKVPVTLWRWRRGGWQERRVARP